MSDCGPEWTVARIKEFHLLAAKWVGGDSRYRIPTKARIACHGDGTPKGPFRWFFKGLKTMPLSARKLDGIFGALKFYTSIKLKQETPLQVKKFIDAVENPDPVKSKPDLWIGDDYSSLGHIWDECKYESLIRWTGLPGKKVLTFEPKIGYLGSVPETRLSLDRHLWDLGLLSTITLRRYYPLYEKAIGNILIPKGFRIALDLGGPSAVPMDERIWDLWHHVRKTEYVGIIGKIQERGAKARIVANPLRGHQVALSKLQQWLQKCVKRGLPWDCTFDQKKGVSWMQTKLQKGYTLDCTDLSSATDVFPLSMIIETLKKIGPVGRWDFDSALELMEHLSRQHWVYKSKLLPNKTSVKWTKGTPMGLYPCFMAFAVTHGFLLRNLEIQSGLEDTFRVLGDDIVMTSEISSQYKKVMEDLGVPVHPYKGLTSDILGEFASKLALKTRVIRAYKFPDSERLFTFGKPLDLLMRYGRKAIKLVPASAREEVTMLASLPSHMGGLGWKPPKHLVHCDAARLIYPSRDSLPDVAEVKERAIPPGKFQPGKQPHSSDGKEYRPSSNEKSFIVKDKRHADVLDGVRAAFLSLERRPAYIKAGSPVTNLDIVHMKNGPDILVVPKEPYHLTCSRFYSSIDPTYHKVEASEMAREEFLSSIDLQWEILHVNSNLENTSPEMEEYYGLVQSQLKKVEPRVTSRFVFQESEQLSFRKMFNKLQRHSALFVQAVKDLRRIAVVIQTQTLFLWLYLKGFIK
jgi:hypothetical protein